MRGLDLEIAWRSPGDLTPHPSNPRRHSTAQKEQLFASVSRFGWTVPIIIDEEQVILAGHGRWEMATENNIESVPTITVAGLSESEKRAYLIADNRLSENADWDYPQLLEELSYLSTQAIEADTLGFSDADLLHMQSSIDDTAFTEPEVHPGANHPRPSVIESSTDPTQVQSTDHGGPSPELAETLVPFSVMMPVDDRERVFDVLNRVRGDQLTLAQALMVVIDIYESRFDAEESDDEG